MWVLIATLAIGVIFVLGFVAGRHIPSRFNLGEAMVVEAIEGSLRRPYWLLNNVTLETENRTTQIDHILVLDTGIFVIETKHYTGWIFGDPQAIQWTQTIYRKKSKFPNPVRQNYGHVKALQCLFNLPATAFLSLVVFTGDAEFKTNLGPTVLKLAATERLLAQGTSGAF
jgi:restriction system protein